MGRYISDQNKVVYLNESGLYGNTSGPGHWIGQVTEHSIDDAENKIEGRFLGTTTRSYSTMDQGPRDATGTLTYNPQAMVIPFITIGSVVSTSGTNSTHRATEINTDATPSAFTSGALCPPRSFTLEDSKQAPGTGKNFVRTLTGVVPNVTTITATQGEKVTVETEYVAQNLAYSSGATTAVTEDTTTPYLWSSTTLTVNGEVLNTPKEASLEINQNMEAPHYLNGSRDISTPFPGNRENILSVTLDLDSDDGTMLYETLYKSNTKFNAVFDLDADSSTGSQHTIYTLSGCRITTMENPSSVEGPTESTVEIRAENVHGLEYSSSDAWYNFNPW